MDPSTVTSAAPPNQKRFPSAAEILQGRHRPSGQNASFQNEIQAQQFLSSLTPFSVDKATRDDTIPQSQLQKQHLVNVLVDAFHDLANPRDSKSKIRSFERRIFVPELVTIRGLELLNNMVEASQTSKAICRRYGSDMTEAESSPKKFATRFDEAVKYKFMRSEKNRTQNSSRAQTNKELRDLARKSKEGTNEDDTETRLSVDLLGESLLNGDDETKPQPKRQKTHSTLQTSEQRFSASPAMSSSQSPRRQISPALLNILGSQMLSKYDTSQKTFTDTTPLALNHIQEQKVPSNASSANPLHSAFAPLLSDNPSLPKYRPIANHSGNIRVGLNIGSNPNFGAQSCSMDDSHPSRLAGSAFMTGNLTSVLHNQHAHPASQQDFGFQQTSNLVPDLFGIQDLRHRAATWNRNTRVPEGSSRPRYDPTAMIHNLRQTERPITNVPAPQSLSTIAMTPNYLVSQPAATLQSYRPLHEHFTNTGARHESRNVAPDIARPDDHRVDFSEFVHDKELCNRLQEISDDEGVEEEKSDDEDEDKDGEDDDALSNDW